MHVVFDRGALRLNAQPGDALHPGAFDVFREAGGVCENCLRMLEPEEAQNVCAQVASTATYGLTYGRDGRVQKDFLDVERRLRSATEAMRVSLFNNVLFVFTISFLIGVVLGGIWLVTDGIALWKKLPEGLDLFVNYFFLIGGWTGFTLIGFSVGWLFLKSAIVRGLERDAAAKEAASLRQRRAHVIYNVLLCLILNIALFFFGGFERIDTALANLLQAAPWAMLLGLVVGVAEPALSERVRGFFRLV
jgi:hypothetical protein